MTAPIPPYDRGQHIPPVAGAYPLRAGNLVRPLIDGGPALRRIGAAVDAARHSVWVTVAFLSADFEMPDGHGSLFDLLGRAAARGVDVRVIFWRPTAESFTRSPTFPGTPADHEMLRKSGIEIRIRWDTVPGPYCHHQKSWLIDAGQPDEIAFVGGINLTPNAAGEPGHAGENQHHDLYAEIAGPSACDVHHNFVQRWNGASERLSDGGVWYDDPYAAMPYPTAVPATRGPSLVQIQRMIPPGEYTGSDSSPDAPGFDIAAGEHSILDQYLSAIDAARTTIFIENQAIPVPRVALRLHAALQRGVDVVALVPAEPEAYMREARRNGSRASLFAALAALGDFGNFTLVGIAGLTAEGLRRNIYVHSKIMLVDDCWATIGSCNLHSSSLGGHTEMNASFWDATAVRALRCALLAEHLGQDTAGLDDRAALRLFHGIAAENRRKRDAGDSHWQGLAFSLDPATYGA